MKSTRHVQIFLEDSLLESAIRGEHNFIGLMQSVLENSGSSTEFLHEDVRPRTHDGYSLVHMKSPLGRKGLTFRRVYHYPFWQIETTEQRWAWDVARDRFDPRLIDTQKARQFQRFWRKRLFGAADVQQNPDGPVYVPLQGRLREHRSFQQMSPIEMLETTIRLEKSRDVIATLHPNESYSAADHAELSKLQETYPHLTISKRNPEELLPRCAYVATQNSAAAFDGYFFDRPAIRFAKIDFHHIGQSLTQLSAVAAFENVLKVRPKFAQYLYWFWQNKSINAGRSDAAEKIRGRFERLGWPLKKGAPKGRL